ncbi:hypothetical protein [Dyella sp. 2RAB6]|uniref:hypothetical protein n=1 Tax=Dyella sp. 2RAB6 TaxID=3232992 RepID=UPI003F8FA461
MFGRKQIALLTHALEFYGKRDNYRRRGIHKKGDDVRYAPSPITQDHGHAARAALGSARALNERQPLLRRIARILSPRPKDLGVFRPTVPPPLTSREPTTTTE